MEKSQKSKIKLLIADNVFTVVSSEDEAYSKQLAAEVDRKIKRIYRDNRTSITAAAILTALNYCDEIHKIDMETDALKQQLGGYLAEISRRQTAYELLERENRRLREELAVYRARLREEHPVSEPAAPLSSPLHPISSLLPDTDLPSSAKKTS